MDVSMLEFKFKAMTLMKPITDDCRFHAVCLIHAVEFGDYL